MGQPSSPTTFLNNPIFAGELHCMHFNFCFSGHMEEATAMSLPDELLIEILSRIDSINPLELRCVCKLWKSLVVNPIFMKKHVFRSLSCFKDLTLKTVERFDACKPQIMNNLALPQEDEEEGASGGEQEEDDHEEEGEEIMMNLLPEQSNFDEDERKQWAINNAALIVSNMKAEGYIKNIRPFLKFLDDMQISNGNVDAMRVYVESMEERVKGLESFMRIFLKCGSI